MLKKVVVLSMLAVFMFGFVGGTFNFGTNAVKAADQLSAKLSMETVIKMVKDKYTNVQVQSVDKEVRDNKIIYEVKFSDSNGDQVINIDANTGKVVNNDEKNYQVENNDHHHEINESDENEIQNNDSEEDGDNNGNDDEDGDNNGNEQQRMNDDNQ